MTLNALIWQIFNTLGVIIAYQFVLYCLIELGIRIYERKFHKSLDRLTKSRLYKAILMVVLCAPYYSFTVIVSKARREHKKKPMLMWSLEMIGVFGALNLISLMERYRGNTFSIIGYITILLIMIINMPYDDDHNDNDHDAPDDPHTQRKKLQDSPLINEINAYLKGLSTAGKR